MEIEAIVLDLEGTLFVSRALSQEHMTCILYLLSRELGVSKENASVLLKSKRKELTRELDYDPPLTMLVETMGISRQRFYEEISKVNPCDHLEPDAKLREMLDELKKKGLKLALLTNAGCKYTTRILKALDIDMHAFDCVVTGDDVQHVKPDPEPFYHVIRSLGVDCQRVLMVGDRIPVDLVTAKRMGWKTVLVSEASTQGVDKEQVDNIIGEIYDLVTVL